MFDHETNNPVMKILSADQVRELEAATIEREPISSLNLMERASGIFSDWFMQRYPDTTIQVIVICGTGNNGGDGLAVARLLSIHEYDLSVIIFRLSNEGSPDFETNLNRLKRIGFKKVDIREISKGDPLPSFNAKAIVIDAIFGSGINRPVKGFWAECILKINAMDNQVVSIDIPSGMMMDEPTEGNAITADACLSFELPKLAFFVPENNRWLARWEARSIGLDKEFLRKVETKHYYITGQWIKSLVRPRHKFAHKGNFGHALLVCGGYGKAGAAVLAARAALRSGAGLVTVHVPSELIPILQVAVPEAMALADANAREFSGIGDISGFDSIGVGSGLGTSELSAKGLDELLTKRDRPVVLDADALNLLAKDNSLLKKLPENSILTPHLKEFERIFGAAGDHFERLRMAQRAAGKYKVIIVLKGAHTAVVKPDGNIYFNSTGNPGMATAGSGDSLTGILTSMLAQGYAAGEAAIISTFIHGLAGDYAAGEKGYAGMTSGDLIKYLPQAFKEVEEL